MPKVERSVSIKAPVEKVFGFMDDPKNLVGIMPGMTEVKDVWPLPTGGSNFNWTYKMAGMRFECASEATEWIANQRIVTETTEGIPSKFTWTYQPEADGMKLTVEEEYIVPIPLLGRLDFDVIIKQNEREADEMLANLKALMEAEAPAVA